MTTTIRAARRRDLPAIYSVLAAAFSDAPIELFIEQTEGDSTLRLRHMRIAEVNGRLSAHVRIFARTMLVRGASVAAGGIGSVASMPDARGLGLPSALLADAQDVMRRDGMPIGFLFTGIPAFYERLGWRVVQQHRYHADPASVAAADVSAGYAVRRIVDRDVPSLLRIYRRATAGRTGAIVRSVRTWRDAQRWLGEDSAGCLIAERESVAVAYVRGRIRPDDYQVLEGAHAAGHAPALASLLAAVGRRAVPLRRPLTAIAPPGHTIATLLRAAPSTVETMDVPHPMMMRIVALQPLLEALLPQLRERAREHQGVPFTLGLTTPDGERATLDVRARTAIVLLQKPAQYALDARGTLDLIVGQPAASELVRPSPPAPVRARIDALFPSAAMHFWNSDRI